MGLAVQQMSEAFRRGLLKADVSSLLSAAQSGRSRPAAEAGESDDDDDHRLIGGRKPRAALDYNF